jgi:hypothetical protein
MPCNHLGSLQDMVQGEGNEVQPGGLPELRVQSEEDRIRRTEYWRGEKCTKTSGYLQ